MVRRVVPITFVKQSVSFIDNGYSKRSTLPDYDNLKSTLYIASIVLDAMLRNKMILVNLLIPLNSNVLN